MIKDQALLWLQQALNAALQLDDHVQAKLAPVQGTLLELIISPLDVSIFMQFNTDGIELLTSHARQADVTLHGNPINFMRLGLMPAEKTRALFNAGMVMTGNIELGQRIKQLFDSIDIDWESHLARCTGDVVAHHVGQAFRQSIAWGQQIQHSLGEQLAEYLHEELRAFPPPEEVNDFYNDIDALSLHVERLEARINCYRAAHEIP